MTKTPYMPLFFGDFLAATAFWEGEAQSLYLLLLAYQWGNGPLPANPLKLAKFVRYEPARFVELWEVVGVKFELTAEGLVNRRLETHRVRAIEISEKRAASGSKGGKATRSSKRNKQTRSKTEANAAALLKQVGGNCNVFAMPSNPIQTKQKNEEAHEKEDLQ